MASSSRTRAAVLASGLLMAAPAAAQTPDAPAPAAPQAAPAPAPAGADAPAQPPAPPPVKARPMSMQPMSMQQSASGPAPAPRRAGRGVPRAWKRGQRGAPELVLNGSPLATAPSFNRLEDGATRIALEVSSRVEVAENKAQGRIVYRLKGAQVGERTNQLPLLTGFFTTPVERMQLVQQGPDVDLVIDLREASEPVQRIVETPRGIVLQIDFPRSVSFEKKGAEPVADTTSRDRAKRRNATQTIRGAAEKSPSEDDGSN